MPKRKTNRSDNEVGEVQEEFNKDEFVLESNRIGGKMIDRIYGGGHLRTRLMQADGTEYKGEIKKKTIYVESKTEPGTRFKSHVYVSGDNRWFDRGGMPIQQPKKVVDDEQTEDE